MDLWQKVIAAKRQAEQENPEPAHGVSTEERDAKIFIAQVNAALGKWEPPKKEPEHPAAHEQAHGHAHDELKGKHHK